MQITNIFLKNSEKLNNPSNTSMQCYWSLIKELTKRENGKKVPCVLPIYGNIRYVTGSFSIW